MPTSNVGLRFHESNIFALPDRFNVGRVFWRAYFRLNTPSYINQDGKEGFVDYQSRDEFYNRMADLLIANGLLVEDAPKNPYANFDNCSLLHIHPNCLSGYLPLDIIENLHDVLARHNGWFTAGWTDVYDARELIGENELRDRVSKSAEFIEDAILDGLVSSKRTDFHNVHGVWSQLVSNMPGFTFMQSPNHGPLLSKLMIPIVENLVARGKLKSTYIQSSLCYRTADEKELALLKPKRIQSKNNTELQQSLSLF